MVKDKAIEEEQDGSYESKATGCQIYKTLTMGEGLSSKNRFGAF